MNSQTIALFFNCLIFGLTAFVSYRMTPFLIDYAHKKNLLDYPFERKAHKRPTPYLGGVAVYASFWIIFLCGLGVLLLLQKSTGYLGPQSQGVIAKTNDIFLGGLIVFVLGIVDDRWNLPPWLKFLGQSVAALILMGAGLTVNLLIDWGPVGYAATFIWLILIMNAFNFIDSIDGHCTGIALISCLIYFCMSLVVYQPVLGFFVMVLGGALAGFLPYNMRPARIFLGDNGSMFIGYMMAAVTLLCTYRTSETASGITPFIPILMFGVPIYDTVSVVVVRLFRGIAPWKGDRNHFAHRLSRLGMSEKVAAFFSYFIAMTLGLVALLSTQVMTQLGSVLVILIFLSVISIVAFLEYYAALRIRLVETLSQQKKRRKEDIQQAEEDSFKI